MSTIKERYLELINHYTGGNRRQFSNKLGLSPSVLENVVGRRETNPSFEVLEKTLNAFESINAKWLITGKGKMFSEEPKRSEPGNVGKDALEMIKELASENALLKKENADLKSRQGLGYNLAAEP